MNPFRKLTSWLHRRKAARQKAAADTTAEAAALERLRSGVTTINQERAIRHPPSSGGYVGTRKTYVVGDRPPEIFQPRHASSDDGMSMLPLAVVLTSMGADDRSMDNGRAVAPSVSGHGGAFDGGGASSNWDASQCSTDSYSSSDSGSSCSSSGD